MLTEHASLPKQPNFANPIFPKKIFVDTWECQIITFNLNMFQLFVRDVTSPSCNLL